MKITDNELLEAYYNAIELNLDFAFIQMLEEELTRRNIQTSKNFTSGHNKQA